MIGKDWLLALFILVGLGGCGSDEGTSSFIDGSTSNAGNSGANTIDLEVVGFAVPSHFDNQANTMKYSVDLKNNGTELFAGDSHIQVQFSRTSDFSEYVTVRSYLGVGGFVTIEPGETVTVSGDPLLHRKLEARNYYVRAEVNMDYAWHRRTTDRNIWEDKPITRPIRGFEEADYSNNYSDTLLITYDGFNSGGEWDLAASCEEEDWEGEESMASAYDLEVGGMVNGEICYDDSDLITVDVDARKLYEYQIEVSSSVMFVALYGPDGEYVERLDSSGDLNPFSPERTGRYYFLVATIGTSAGSYSVTFDER